MRGVGGAITIAVAALLVCCSADSHQDQEASAAADQNSADRYDASGHKMRNLNSLGGEHPMRDVQESRPLSSLMSYLMARRYNAYGGKHERLPASSELGKFYNTHKRNFDEIDRSDLNPFLRKRNFDEIDLSEMNPFTGMGKRNFDEIDLSSLPFSFATKRYYHTYGNNYLDTPVEAWKAGFDKKRLQPEYPMDEIDLSNFPIGSKRSLDNKIHDIERYHSSGVDKKRLGAYFPADEIDASHFPIGSRRSLPLR